MCCTQSITPGTITSLSRGSYTVYAFVAYRTVSIGAAGESVDAPIFDFDCSETDGEVVVVVNAEVEIVLAGHVSEVTLSAVDVPAGETGGDVVELNAPLLNDVSDMMSLEGSNN
jgi:hypothetical protein